MKKQIKDLKKGEYFTLMAIDEPLETQVYVRDEYDRTARMYEVHKFSDVNFFRFMRGDRYFYVGFPF